MELWLSSKVGKYEVLFLGAFQLLQSFLPGSAYLVLIT